MDGAMASETSLGQKTFAWDDQERFAALSQDRNPMHMDAVAARRLLSGSAVVHGVHAMFVALELWMARDARKPASVRCTFNNPINVGDTVQYVQKARDDGGVQLEGSVESLVCCQVVLSFDAQGSVDGFEFAGAPLCSGLAQPLDEPPADQLGQLLRVGYSTAGMAEAFPECAKRWDRETVAAVAALSYMVGMVCPGLHSVFSSLRFEVAQDNPSPQALGFRIARFDARVQLFDIEFAGRIRGSLRTFRRPAPQPQPGVEQLSQVVRRGEFEASRSLIIGGSRGLGQLASTMLAAGGGEVTVSYAAGRDDAEALCAAINKAVGSERSRAVKIDVLQDAFESVPVDWGAFDAVYYFPTPRIFRKRASMFDARLLGDFTKFYVEKFYELALLLEARQGAKVRVYLPSTVFVAERPKGMTEYAMAKAAAEVLASDINRSFRHVEVVMTRLPKLNTDQTAGILQSDTGANAQTLLPVLRSMQAGLPGP